MWFINKEKVKEAMYDKGIYTYKDLSKRMGISNSQLSSMFSKDYNPVKTRVTNMCELLDIDLGDIIEMSKQMELELTELSTGLKDFNSTDFRAKETEYIDVRGIKPLKEYKVLELFAGAGGLALGLEKSGFRTIGLVENDKYACDTLRFNREEWNIIEEDIEKVTESGIDYYIDKEQLKDLDLISGGYPCQAFSYAGKKRGLKDARGTLFYHYAKLLDDLRPKLFLVENVRGLVNHDKGRTLETMINVFKDVGYVIKWDILSALDYNVAQKRERIIIVGIRKDLVKEYKLEYLFPETYGTNLTLRDVLKDVPKSVGAKYPESKRKVLEMVSPGGYWRDLPKDVAKEYMGKSYYSGGGRTGMARRLSWDEPSLTLTCSPAQKQTERCHPSETRPFTVREYARIQSFPDTWEFKCSMYQAYKQIGNAVPVNMAEAIGLSLINVLNQLEVNK